jgi:hypothetical protein
VTRRTQNHDEAPGQDSFLDIVANLVGILIILVMVVGVRAKDALVKADAAKQAARAAAVPKLDITAARAAADGVQSNINQLAGKIDIERAAVSLRRMERDQVHVLITAMERELDKRRQQLSEDDRRAFDMRRELAAARNELDDTKRKLSVIESSDAPPTVIDHLPTPMAKTVFGREVHFRLLAGQLTVVPWEELVEKLKAEAPQKVWKLKDAPRITETIGPIRGFRMKYTLKRAEYALETRVGIAIQRGIELEQFVLAPVSDELGEPLAAALQDGSQFLAILDGYDPSRTTVTVWVYPDSFNDFRTLRHDLYQRGYLTAGRPMPEGQLIGGAPNGTRSSAQ